MSVGVVAFHAGRDVRSLCRDGSFTGTSSRVRAVEGWSLALVLSAPLTRYTNSASWTCRSERVSTANRRRSGASFGIAGRHSLHVTPGPIRVLSDGAIGTTRLCTDPQATSVRHSGERVWRFAELSPLACQQHCRAKGSGTPRGDRHRTPVDASTAPRRARYPVCCHHAATAVFSGRTRACGTSGAAGWADPRDRR